LPLNGAICYSYWQKLNKDINLQRIIEFKKKTFWASSLDINALNDQVSSLNKDGWIVKEIISNTYFFGGVYSYTLLLDLK